MNTVIAIEVVWLSAELAICGWLLHRLRKDVYPGTMTTAGNGRKVRKTESPGPCPRCKSWRYLGGSEIFIPEYHAFCCMVCGLLTATTAAERRECLTVVRDHG
jgi:hypothetical protein